jgi:ribosomal protein S18 acetylase RimI-like enzyme
MADVRPASVRRASVADAAELARLRVLMFASLGEPVDEDLYETCVAGFEQRLADLDGFAAYVVERPDSAGRLAACGAGFVEQRLPGPGRPSGLVGHLSCMSTDLDQRRRGHARAVLVTLLDWFRARGVGHVDLHASVEGSGLYRSVGFAEPRWPALRWRP